MATPRSRHVKYLVRFFVILSGIYLLPHVAINAFYYPDNEIYGPAPAAVESVFFTANDGTRLHGWFIPSATGAYSALFDHGLALKFDQRFASIRSTGNLTFPTAF